MHLTIFDLLVLGSCAWFCYVAVLHNVAAREMYVFGSDYGVPGYDNWRPTTYKQALIKGVFFVIPFPWISSLTLTALLVLSGDANPLGGWLGVINCVFQIPQLVSVTHNAGQNKIGKFVMFCFGLHIVTFTLWALHKFGFGLTGFLTMALTYAVGAAVGVFLVRYENLPPGTEPAAAEAAAK